MKKIAFCVQVISLIAMFPLLVILEMNHANEGCLRRMHLQEL